MILNESFLRHYAKYEMRGTLNDNYNALKHFDNKESYDVFISHSSLDKELTCSIYDLFVQNGFTVYLDYEDLELNPRNVSSSTGEKLRSKMKRSKCLSYISTSISPTSKWCPWELGYYDGVSEGKCCILPIIKGSQKTFKGQEYLGMYPYLEYEKYADTEEYDFGVIDQENSKKYTTFSSWLKGGFIKLHE